MEELENEEKTLQNGAHSVPEIGKDIIPLVPKMVTWSTCAFQVYGVGENLVTFDDVDCGGETAEGSSTETSLGAVDTARMSPRYNEEPDSRNRTFTVTGLRHPGGWRTHSEIINMLARCESFNIKFERAAKQKGPKPGCISLTFDSISSAREAFTQAQKIRIDGQAIKVEAGPCFFAPATCRSRPFFKVPSDEEVRKRTIYALDLPTSAEQSLLNSIFGVALFMFLVVVFLEFTAFSSWVLGNAPHFLNLWILEADHIEKITFLPLRSQLKQAEVVMHTEEQVEAARSEDGFELDDGQQQSVLRILTPADYATFVEQEQKPIPFVPQVIPPSTSLKPPVTCESQPTVAPPADVKLAPVLDEDDITDMFIKYVTAHRVNWAEITDVMELYTICDAVSAQIGGLPDSVLRPAMLHTLQRHLTEAQTAWMRDHLQFLIKGWKHEVRSEAFVDRPTLVQMKAAEYVPVAPSKKRFRGKNSAQSRAGRVLMGVGALMVTEEGELEVEEDDDGNITLGGEALSFETWAKQNQKEWKEKKVGAIKMRIMQQAREELNALDKSLGKERVSKEAENGKERVEKLSSEKPSKPQKEEMSVEDE
uniref:RRM domain-containing protein n=1 Tax=Angiostrongylus cantonensis TaxID=6313 RepID=A0A0K0CYN0_ANGCA